MKAVAIFLAVLMIICAVIADRTIRVNSCYDDIDGKTQKDKCLSAWEPLYDDSAANPANACQHCVAKAVPDVCANSQQAQQLPPGVFICTNVTAIPKF